MEGARTDQHGAFMSGLREAERVSSPLLSPAPAAAWHPAEGCGHVPKRCSADIQPCQAPLLLLNWCAIFQHQSGKKSLWAGQKPDTLLFVLCAVPVCHSCVSGWQNIFLVLLRWVWFQLEVLMRCFMWHSGLQLFKGTWCDLFTVYWPAFIKHVRTSTQISPNRSCFNLFTGINVLY